MHFEQTLTEGIIQRRYKRFLADVELPNGELITAHVANTGPMTSCWAPGQKVLLSHHPHGKRKLPYSLEMTHNGESWIGVNTANPNRIVKEALQQKKLPPFQNYQEVQPEVRFEKSRLDFLLRAPGLEDCYLEVKSVTLREANSRIALFPDTVSTRAQKHLETLLKLKKLGHRAAMLYLVQREDVDYFAAAKHIDPRYAELFQQVEAQGVEVFCYQCQLSAQKIVIAKELPRKNDEAE